MDDRQFLEIFNTAEMPQLRRWTDELWLANALRLERQAAGLIARGYRIGELHSVEQHISLRAPAKLENGCLSMEPRGDIQIRHTRSEWRLSLRRGWRKFFPYSVAGKCKSKGRR